MAKHLIPLAGMERILKDAGAERISEDSKTALYQELENYSEKISHKATRLANHANRQTIKARDVKLAIEQ